MCSPWYRKTMILNHCPRGKPSASLDSIWNLARHIPIAYSPFFFSCGNRFLLIQPHNLIWFYSQCSIHLGSMVAGEQKEAGHGELTLPYACNPETPKRHHQFSLRFACIYFKWHLCMRMSVSLKMYLLRLPDLENWHARNNRVGILLSCWIHSVVSSNDKNQISVYMWRQRGETENIKHSRALHFFTGKL